MRKLSTCVRSGQPYSHHNEACPRGTFPPTPRGRRPALINVCSMPPVSAFRSHCGHKVRIVPGRQAHGSLWAIADSVAASVRVSECPESPKTLALGGGCRDGVVAGNDLTAVLSGR